MNDSYRQPASRSGRVTPLASALALTLFTGLAVSPAASTHPTLDMARGVAQAAPIGNLLPTPAADSAYYTVILNSHQINTFLVLVVLNVVTLRMG